MLKNHFCYSGMRPTFRISSQTINKELRYDWDIHTNKYEVKRGETATFVKVAMVFQLLKPGGPSTFGCDELERNVSVDG